MARVGGHGPFFLTFAVVFGGPMLVMGRNGYGQYVPNTATNSNNNNK